MRNIKEICLDSYIHSVKHLNLYADNFLDLHYTSRY